MFWTCRATVRSLMTSSVAMSRLLMPVATRRRTLNLARAQAVSVRRGAACELIDTCDLGCGAELLERVAGGLELHRLGVVVAQRGAGETEQDTRARRLVGRLELLPRPPGASERRDRAAGIPLGERERASGVRGRRGEQLAPLPRRDLIELSTGGSRRFEVSDRKGDLYRRRGAMPPAGAAEPSRPGLGEWLRPPSLPCPGPGGAERAPVAARGRSGLDSL